MEKNTEVEATTDIEAEVWPGGDPDRAVLAIIKKGTPGRVIRHLGDDAYEVEFSLFGGEVTVDIESWEVAPT